MKKILFAIVVFSIFPLISGQVGINIAAPTAILDVNGDARVRKINPANTGDYILSADANGVLHKTSLTAGDLDGSSETSGLSVKKNQYFGTIADAGKTITAGVVEIRLYPVNGTSTTDVYPQIRLISPPSAPIQVVVLDDETWPNGGTEGGGVTLSFNSTNYATWMTVGRGTMVNNEKNVLTFAVPGTKDLYRATCYIVANSSTPGEERLYNLILEKF